MAKDPKDSRIMEYKDTISQLNMTVKSQNELIVSLRQTIDANHEAMAVMSEKIDYLTKKLFGTSSEKSKNVEGQMSLFDEAEQEAAACGEQEAEETVVKEHTRKAKGTYAEFFSGVPVKDEVIPLSEEQKRCTDCGAEMEVIGREFVRREFRFTPAKGEAVNIYRETAKCPVCSQAPAMERAVSFVKAHVPETLILHSYASASAVAWTMYQKYANSMPLYRQEQDWKELDYSNPAAQGVQYCNKLFEHERQSREKGHTCEQRKEYRLKKEKPVLDAFWEWVSEQSPKKGTRFEKAVNYAQNHKEQFMTYLEDGRCSFSNNLSENSIRPFTVGRRNWLFSDTPKGADASAIVYTMVEMAKAHNLNIYKYLNYLLEHLPETRMRDSELSGLAPWDAEVISKCSGAM